MWSTTNGWTRENKNSRHVFAQVRAKQRAPASPRSFRPLCASAALLLAAFAAALSPGLLRADKLDEMSLERWAKLREVERYQMKIAEKYYREKDYKVALAEYEKFLRLYERSEGAPHAQLKWSLCLVQRRQLNTAIKDGFQSVIDYWPESPDAVAAHYYIGKTYKDMGEIRAAKKAYGDLLTKYKTHQVAAFAQRPAGHRPLRRRPGPAGGVAAGTDLRHQAHARDGRRVPKRVTATGHALFPGRRLQGRPRRFGDDLPGD